MRLWMWINATLWVSVFVGTFALENVIEQKEQARALLGSDHIYAANSYWGGQ